MFGDRVQRNAADDLRLIRERADHIGPGFLRLGFYPTLNAIAETLSKSVLGPFQSRFCEFASIAGRHSELP